MDTLKRVGSSPKPSLAAEESLNVIHDHLATREGGQGVDRGEKGE